MYDASEFEVRINTADNLLLFIGCNNITNCCVDGELEFHTQRSTICKLLMNAGIPDTDIFAISE